jgi:pyruvate dehydrogenase E1 component alpha subunit
MWKPEPSLSDLRYVVARSSWTEDRLRDAYRKLCLARAFEEAIAERYYVGKTPEFNLANGEIRGEMHLASGQEAVAVGVCSQLRDEDVVVSTHRPHQHALAKGVDPGRLAAEIMGRATGLCGGKGGHMHLFDTGCNFSCSGIVGASFPQAAGAAMALKRRGTQAVAVAFAGEGAANHGTFAETLNAAVLWQLPLVIVIEDNMYADSTPRWAATASTHLQPRAMGYNVPSAVVDGMDLIDVDAAAQTAVCRARDGYGPSVVEAVCYRYRGHFEGDAQDYRTPEEVERWRAMDPIDRLGFRLKRLEWADDEVLDQRRRSAEEEVAKAMAFAEQSPLPETDEALVGVFR